jgi:hypothetical protein
MSVAMLVAGRAGWMGQQPPKRITDAALENADVDVESDATLDALAVASHYAFGMSCGALFGLVHERVRPPGPSLLHGVGFGLFVWSLSYLGWIPALGILPPAHRDRPGRRRTMFLAHVLYGGVLGMSARRHD